LITSSYIVFDCTTCGHLDLQNIYVLYIQYIDISVWYTHISVQCTGLFISPSGTSELDCATTKRDMAERNISIGRESLKVFLY